MAEIEEYVIIGKKSLEELKEEISKLRQTCDKIKDRQTGLEIAIKKETPEASEAIEKLEKVVQDVETLKNTVSSKTETIIKTDIPPLTKGDTETITTP